MAKSLNVLPCDSYLELLERNIDYIVEATNPSATKEILKLTIARGINVGVATALATMGVYDTNILIKSEPSFIGDSQCIDIECGDEIKAHLDIYSKISDIAGYSVVALLQNLESPIVF